VTIATASATPPAWWRIGLMPPLVATLPLALLVVALLAGFGMQMQRERQASLTRTVATLQAALEAELQADTRLLKLLAATAGPASAEAFRSAAQGVLARDPGWHNLALEDAQARQIDLRRPAEAPPTPLPDPASLARVLQSGRPAFSGQRDGLVSLRVPVLREEVVRLAVVAEIPLASLAADLARLPLPPGWALRLTDAQGETLVERGPPPLGTPPLGTPGAEAGTLSRQVGETGWRLAITPAPFGRITWLFGLGSVLALLLGLGLAARLAWRGRAAVALHQQHQAEALAHAADLERRRADLLATVSHELRAPLTGLLGYTELLSRAELPPTPHAWVQQQRRAGQALLALVGDVLDFARLEDGAIALEDTSLDLFELLEDAAALLRAVAQQKALGLVIQRDPGLPRWVRGDPLRLRQVVINLLGNAIKFTAQGEVVLSARIVARPERLEISVSDTGIGICEEALPRIFDRFQQGADDTARRFGGSGLGLAICRRLVVAMGGTITAESLPGRGSRFTLRVPFRPGQPPDDGSREGEPRMPLRILVAEDVPASRLLLVAVLERAGHAVTAVEDGPRALAAVHGTPFDLAMVDLRMPGLDGFGVAAALRTLPGERGRMKLVALTAEAPEEVEAACQEAGFDALLRKPFETRRLLGLVEALGRHPAPRHEAAARSGGVWSDN